jgi:hypothetical protein
VPQLNNIYAGTWNATAGKDIGKFGVNPIETNAPIQNLLAGGNIDVTNTGNVLLNADATNGSIRFQSTGDILLGHSFAPNGSNSLIAGGSIFSQGGPSVRVIAYDVIRLIAGGVVGTASNRIQTQLNHAGNLFLEAHGQQGILSANIQGNFTRASLQFLNTPPGLVIFNGIASGGDALKPLERNTSSLYFNPNPISLPAYAYFNGRYSADFPRFFDQNRFAFAPVTSISTAPIDVLPIEGLGILPPVVPIPGPAVPPVPVPVPEAGRPPLTVPLPGLAKAPAPLPVPERIPGPVYVAPGHVSDTSASQGQAGLAGDQQKKKKALESAAPAGTLPLVVPVPSSSVPLVQESETQNSNPPFPVSPIASEVRAAGKALQQAPSPIENKASVTEAGQTQAPAAGVSAETSNR